MINYRELQLHLACFINGSHDEIGGYISAINSQIPSFSSLTVLC